MKATDTGVKRILKAFTYSYAGFISAFRYEAAFRQDLVVFIAGTIAAVLMPVEMTARALLISSLILILLMELVNTGLETVIDRISEEYHILSKRAKDIGSLLVLIAFVNAAVIWFCVLWDCFK
ncbi:MAG: diacylglycerol kinase [Alphaproteobacteria bacterium]